MKAFAVLFSTLVFSLSVAAQQAENKAPGPGEATPETKQKVSNAGLTGKVKTALAADVGMKTLMSIDVDSDEGVVTLKGHVDSADVKSRAEAVAKKVDGVSSVKNELEVRAPKKG
jgi:hyperosmotically inducible periplasmic protein